MNTATTRRDTVTVDLDYLSSRKRSLQFTLGGRIGSWIAKLRSNHCAITDIEIDVAGSEVVVCKRRSNP